MAIVSQLTELSGGHIQAKCNFRCTNFFGLRCISTGLTNKITITWRNKKENTHNFSTWTQNLFLFCIRTTVYSNPFRVCWCSRKNERKKNNAVAPTYIAINMLQIDLKLRNHFSASVGFKAAVKHGISIAKFMNELIPMLNSTASTMKTTTTMGFRHTDLITQWFQGKARMRLNWLLFVKDMNFGMSQFLCNFTYSLALIYTIIGTNFTK